MKKRKEGFPSGKSNYRNFNLYFEDWAPWLISTSPSEESYYPQIGDIVMYFRQVFF